MTTLTHEQKQAVKAINAWLKSPSWEFRLGGYAGTGKTFLLQHIIRNYSNPLCVCAPTGKAASVLQSKLENKTVTTIHKAMYKPVMPSSSKAEELKSKLNDDPSNKELRQQLKEAIEEQAQIAFALNEAAKITPQHLVIIDEASMVTRRIYDDLQSKGCKVLFVGDPGQLPPVKDAGWFNDEKLDYQLMTIQRQALDSPIIRLSMEVREGNMSVKDYTSEPCQVVDTAPPIEEWSEWDQIITGRNSTRQRINRQMRELRGYESELPVEGDKLICLKNQMVSNKVFLINGVICSAAGDTTYEDEQYRLDVDYEGETINARLYSYPLLSHYQTGVEEIPYMERKDLREFDYGYAITVHKSQGSEWDRVVLYDDKMQYKNKEFRRRWLYTAITRAKNQLLWIRG